MSSEHFEALIVGAGFGGIGAAIQFKRMGIDDFVILDREDDLGGTWHVNHYPGLAVDVPTTTYSYFFEPNPNWSRLFTPGPEIKQYAAGVADKYDVRRHMRFNTVVESARWDDESRHWQVALSGGDVLSARYLVTATGFLSQPKTPDIPGITTFEGKVIHTTEWQDDFDPTGRRIGIIGTGAAAVQLIPQLADKAADLTVYQRTPIWVAPKTRPAVLGSSQTAFRAFTVDTAADPDDHRHHLRVDNQRRRAAIPGSTVPAVQHLCDGFVQDQSVSGDSRQRTSPQAHARLRHRVQAADVLQHLFRSFTKPHVHLQADGIERVEADGIVNADGSKTHIDTLVLATGFDLWEANFPAIEVIGRDGRNLGEVVARHAISGVSGRIDALLPN